MSDWRYRLPKPQEVAIPTFTATHDADNRIATWNSETVTHDNDGNMTFGPLPGEADFASYSFDVRNRLTGVGGVTYTYDSENNRIAKTTGDGTTTYVFDPHGDALPRVLVRERPDETLTYYVYGIGLLYEVDEADNATYYHFDQTGSTIALTNESGEVTDRIDEARQRGDGATVLPTCPKGGEDRVPSGWAEPQYTPYGTVSHRTGDTDTPFLYVGQLGIQADPNGLLYMRARYYSPELKRFINADPAGFGGGLNWYMYANNSPLMYVDPTGLDAIIDIGYTRAAGYGAHGQYHAFAIITDTITGQKMVTRAGPSSGDREFNPTGIGFGYLKADVFSYPLHPRDNPGTTVHIQPVGTVKGDFADVVNAARNFRDVTNANKIAYTPIGGGIVGYNSNSYAGTFIQSLGFPRPNPNLPSPGFRSGSISPNLSYTPFRTSNVSFGTMQSSGGIK